MRKLVLTALALGLLTSAPAAAQMWQPEIGIKAGWVRASFADTDQTLDMIDIPGVGGLLAAGEAFILPAPLYGIIPIGDRMAIEPSFGFQNINGGASLTSLTLGARFNYAFTPNLYVGVGPTMYLVKASGIEDAQGALQGAVGYRRPLGGSFSILAEGFYEVRENSEILSEVTTYGLRIGAGSRLGGGTAGGASQGSSGMWRPAIGIQGGWSLVSIVDNADVTVLSLPFASQSIIGGTNVLPGPSALFLIIPIGAKLAVEPSFDLHNFKPEGSDAVTTYEIGGKLNYAFNRTLYVGAGAEFTGLSAETVDDGSSLSIVLATGARFPIAGGLQGRTELNYRMFDGTDLYGGGQTTAFAFGIMVPVR
jgi:hypothetical protein